MLTVREPLRIGQTDYLVAVHPASPALPFGQEGREATVYQLLPAADTGAAIALKVFKPQYQTPGLVGLSERLAPFAGLPGLAVCRRRVLTPQQDAVVLQQHPELLYAAVMPWIAGQSWFEVLMNRQQITAELALQLARSFADVLAACEQQGVAHGDLSGANVLLPVRGPADGTDSTFIELVDVEHLHGPGLTRPLTTPGGSPGYAHASGATDLWQPGADRFAGAVLLAEMLGWCDERVRQAAWGESYFAPDEMQQPSTRYRTLEQVLRVRWGDGIATLLSQVWTSTTLGDCPSFGAWVITLPTAVPPLPPVLEPTEGRDDDSTQELTAVGEADLATWFDAAVEALGRNEWAAARELLSVVVQRRPDYRRNGKGAAALLAVAAAHSGDGNAAPASARWRTAIAAVAAYEHGEWAAARELLAMVVQRRPEYVRNGQHAATLLKSAHEQLKKQIDPTGSGVFRSSAFRAAVLGVAALALLLLLGGGAMLWRSAHASAASTLTVAAAIRPTSTAVPDATASATTVPLAALAPTVAATATPIAPTATAPVWEVGGTRGSAPGQFNRPFGVAVDGQGNVYVADSVNQRIQKLSASGQPLTQWGTAGSAPGQFAFPVGVAVDGHGNVYVADEDNHRIQKLSASGQ